VKVGSFARKKRYATEYRLTEHRDDLTGALPTRAFMKWQPPRSDQKDTTVRPRGHSQDNCRSRSDHKDRHGQKEEIHGPIRRTHVESSHRPLRAAKRGDGAEGLVDDQKGRDPRDRAR
jgi:hypothetical protein